jgi:hypothetical protein
MRLPRFLQALALSLPLGCATSTGPGTLETSGGGPSAGPTGGVSPSETGGTLPEGSGGTLPEGSGGTLPEGSGGTLPEGSGGTLPEGSGGTAAGGSGDPTTCTGSGCDGDSCLWVTDCQSGVCGATGVCICGNGIQDGIETGIDCGGECGGCPGAPCESDAECGPHLLCDGTCTHCTNGVQDRDETGLDCGGSCPGCFADPCTDPSECAAGTCEDGACGRTFCLEGWKDDPAGTPCTTCEQEDQCFCEQILDCYIANRCASPQACHETCNNTDGGGAAMDRAGQVFEVMCP